VTKEFGSAVGGTVDIPPDIRQAELDGLMGVPKPGGTAARAFAGFNLDAFPVAGKTGTAQVLGKADTAVFSAFGPAYAPQYQVTVVLEESGFGGTASAPVARALFDVLSGAAPKPIVERGGILPPPAALTAGAGVD
jgi:penicillin-binding protein 2